MPDKTTRSLYTGAKNASDSRIGSNKSLYGKLNNTGRSRSMISAEDILPSEEGVYSQLDKIKKSAIATSKEIRDTNLKFDKAYHNQAYQIFERRKKKEILLNRKVYQEQYKQILSIKASLSDELNNTAFGIFSKLGAVRDAKVRLESDPDSKKNQINMINSMSSLKRTIITQVKRVTDAISNYISSTAKTMDALIPALSTNLGTDRWGAYNTVMDALSYRSSSGLNGAVTSREVMESVNKLAASGYQSNISALSVIDSLGKKISTNFNIESLNNRFLSYGWENSTQIAQASLGSEAALKGTLKEYFGNTLYIQKGIYNKVRDQLSTALLSASNSEKSLELEYQIQKGIGSLVSVGLSSQGQDTLSSIISDLSTQGYTTSAIGNLALARSGLSASEIFNASEFTGEMGSKLIGGFVDSLRSANSSTVGSRGQWAKILGVDASDLTQEKLDKLVSAYDKVKDQNLTYEEMLETMKKESGLASSRQSIEQEILNNVKSIADSLGVTGGIIGGNITSTVAGLGSAVISTVLGTALFKGATKLIGGKLTTAGGSAAGSAAAGGASGATTALGGLLTKSGGAGSIKGWNFSGGAKALGVAGGIISTVGTTAGAISNKTYSDNGFLNGLAGAVMGNQSGDSSFGGYAKSFLSNAARGASFGMLGGPIGALIGAAAGGVAGIVGNAISASRKKSEASAQSGAASAASGGSVDYSSYLTTINNSITYQTTALSTALTNIYQLIARVSTNNSRGSSVGDLVK